MLNVRQFDKVSPSVYSRRGGMAFGLRERQGGQSRGSGSFEGGPGITELIGAVDAASTVRLDHTPRERARQRWG